MLLLAKAAVSNLDIKQEVVLNNHEGLSIPKSVRTTHSPCDTVTTGQVVGSESEGRCN